MHRNGNWLRWLMILAVLGIASPAADAARGGNGKPGGGGGGDPACSGWVYSIYEKTDGLSGPHGIARACLDDDGTELITGYEYGSRNEIEVSPDGTHVLCDQNGGLGVLVPVANPSGVLRFHASGQNGEIPADLPTDFHPTWSWRVDGNDDPLPWDEQFVAAVTASGQQIRAYHPVPGAAQTELLDISDGGVDPSLWISDLHWLAGQAADRSISWLVFRIRRNSGAWIWHALTVETAVDGAGDATIQAVGAPVPLTTDTAFDNRLLRFSKFGTHAAWILGGDSGLKRVELAYDAAHPYAPPILDGATEEDLTYIVDHFDGFMQFGHIGMSHDGGRLAAFSSCELWTVDLAEGLSSLARITPKSRRNRPCYGGPAWAE